MKKLIPLVALSALVLCGCSSTSGERQMTDGSVLKVANSRFLWASQGVEMSTKDKDGFEFTLKLQKSNPDIDAIKAVAEGVAAGAVRGAKP